VAKIGEVSGEPEPVAVSTTDKGLVTVWLGFESTDLSPEAAEQLAAFLKVAAARSRQQG
jgi:hypothetical protein